MGARACKPKKKVDPDELLRMMNDNTDVVVRFYNSNRDFIEKYIVDHFWEEDVERWLTGIRKRSPSENLKVRKVDFLKTLNEKEHNTSLYEAAALVLRRAGQFDLNVDFGNRAFDANRDDLTLSFSVGNNPSEAAGTKLVCPVGSKPGKKTSWHCYVVSRVDKKLSLRVNIPADAIVGRYAVSLEILSGTSDGRNRTEHVHDDNSIIVLFNPFSEDDTVYMADETMRNEYAMNDEGFIAQGSYWRFGKKTWEYAQFDKGVLDNVLKMIQNDTRHIAQPVKSWKKCNDPVYVSRVLSAMVNSNDDRGVLSGKWDGKYDDGKTPGSWHNSGTILKQWAESELQPVKYGQCWVFSGVLNTALRALGIPARCITNFASAHDSNSNVTVDMYYDADTGDKMDETSDSVWNFHVWNEGYFGRPDLPEGYGGWQVLDATPQELSEVVGPSSRRRELYQCGPCPVKAIKEGRIDLGFDGNFIFGEVNADKVKWFVKDGKVTQANIMKHEIGKNITTKAIGSWKAEDVTLEYKYAEGTEEERIAFNKAYGRGTEDHSTWGIKNPELLMKSKFEVKITLKEETVLVGANILTTVTVKNISDAATRTNIKISANSKRHVGSMHALLKKLRQTVTIDAGKEVSLSFGVEQTEYIRNIVDDNVINIRVVATDEEDGNTQVEEHDVQLEMPQCISTTAPASILRGEVLKFDIIFENKFPITVTKGVVNIAFIGNKLEDKKVTVEQPIAPGHKFTVKDVEVSLEDGRSRIYKNVYFDCAEVKGLHDRFGISVA